MNEYNIYDNQGNEEYVEVNHKHRSISFIGKTFAFMVLGLVITALSGFSMILALYYGALSPTGYLGLLIGSCIASFILVLVTQLFALKNKKGGWVLFILYSMAMGIILSTLMMMYDLVLLGYAFLCTIVSFAAMGIYGAFSKSSMVNLGMFGIGALFGVLTLTLVNLFLGSELIYYIITYIGLAAILALCAFDVNRIVKLSKSGEVNNGLVIYMALQLYTDFIYIFIRFVIILARNKR
jgi:hypothetical protein